MHLNNMPDMPLQSSLQNKICTNGMHDFIMVKMVPDYKNIENIWPIRKSGLKKKSIF